MDQAFRSQIISDYGVAWPGWCHKCEYQGTVTCQCCRKYNESGMPELFAYKSNASDFEQIIGSMLKIHKAKNNDYSPKGQFGNFAESERIGVPDWKGAFIRLQDKYTRCCNLIGGREAQVLDEKLEDTLLDLANYAVIVMCLMKNKE